MIRRENVWTHKMFTAVLLSLAIEQQRTTLCMPRWRSVICLAFLFRCQVGKRQMPRPNEARKASTKRGRDMSVSSLLLQFTKIISMKDALRRFMKAVQRQCTVQLRQKSQSGTTITSFFWECTRPVSSSQAMTP